MKFLYTLIFILTSISLQAQCKLIAFRSHSGNISHYNSRLEPDNLGIPPMYLDTIIWISDTSCVEKTSYRWNGWPNYTDTVYYHPYCNNSAISYDSLKTSIYPEVVLIGFDSTKKVSQVDDTLAKHRERFKTQNERQKNNSMPAGKISDNNGGSPSSNYFVLFVTLTFVVLITGATKFWISHSRLLAGR
jgi:hypothetical protein